MAKVVWSGAWECTVDDADSGRGYDVRDERVRIVEAGGRHVLERLDGLDSLGTERWREASLAEFFTHGAPLATIGRLATLVDRMAAEAAALRTTCAALQARLDNALVLIAQAEARTAVPPPRDPPETAPRIDRTACAPPHYAVPDGYEIRAREVHPEGFVSFGAPAASPPAAGDDESSKGEL